MEGQYDGLNATLVHQLKKKIEELKEEKERFTQLFEQSNDGIILSDFNGKIFGTNKKAEEITGYSEKALLGMHIWQIIPESEKKKVGESFKRVLRNKSELVESSLIRKDRKIVDVNVSAKVITLKESSFVQAIIRDITERKKAEEALKESEEKYRALVENSTDWIFMLDKNLKFLSANSMVSRVLRTPVKELIGKSIFEFFPKEIAIQFAKNNTEVFKTGKNKFIEEKMIVKGNEFYISTILNPIKDVKGNVTAVVGITRDITKRKKTEEELRESEEKFRAIFENAGEGILIADAKTREFIFANPRICKILGYKEKELLKLKVEDIHPKKDLHYIMKQFKKQLQKKMLTANLPVLRKDKKVIFCDITATPLIIKGKEYITGFFLEK